VEGLKTNELLFDLDRFSKLLDDHPIMLQSVQSFRHEVLSDFRQFMFLYSQVLFVEWLW
jgi:hypothetical protein